MDEKALENAGLTRIETRIYLSLIESGACLAGTITRNSGIQRRTVYDALERLIQKGLVSYIKTNNRRYFQAVDPKRLVDIARSQLEKVESQLPELELRYKMSKEKKETTFFRGKYGLKSIFNDQIETAREVLVLGASTNAYDVFKFYFDHYDRFRQKKKVFVRAIFNEKVVRQIPYAAVRYLPKEYSSHTVTNIYGNKVAIVLWSDNPFAILIDDKEIADSYRKYFELLWKIARP